MDVGSNIESINMYFELIVLAGMMTASVIGTSDMMLSLTTRPSLPATLFSVTTVTGSSRKVAATGSSTGHMILLVTRPSSTVTLISMTGSPTAVIITAPGGLSSAATANSVLLPPPATKHKLELSQIC